MRIPFIGGNWKMNLSLDTAVQFVKEIKDQLPPADKVETAIAASPLFLESMLQNNQDSPLFVTAENCFYKDEGAYTGEVSPKALSQMGIQYVIVGHSERRNYFNETNDIINKKVHAVIRNHMKPIICCDETMGRFENGDHFSWVVNQVTAALHGVDETDAEDIVIAYEPSWAIGTGHSASTEEAEEGCYLIRQTLADIYSDETADKIRILYGGSVTQENIAALMKEPDIDGVLAGKASLNPKEFVKLANYQTLK
ncbi:triose-phosphate isomerase [Fructilactobacillus lindneri]|uniref:Triosephosphate isomerase n=2 Tax=Fructilactobacillus lindneri TaxID=53444 RepID=A0A0R2JZ02_9LACO|nr:triose-phosphate isomerase [Fructilactobacillus lindneri]ANZ58447.1 triose-phosphate isomerase [Fructilactobacillus lindneri]ANZ59757.1 triose-phosphate isomerase [Fructilactobacillus lindneri]KRN79277.1 Triosephosphate isomerase [Fructilactobacillus lindneri DSM 20690 = JCM 11027]POG98449.1 triose-phosphate isomerase [Fructilactobacillus lindneri]POH03848.1 triose-phosphate isomerase [Fructilactobacillus lindneri]